MDGLTNAFSVLQLDAEDDRLQSASTASPLEEPTCSATPGFALSTPFFFRLLFFLLLPIGLSLLHGHSQSLLGLGLGFQRLLDQGRSLYYGT
jgi:hypothetical protein